MLSFTYIKACVTFKKNFGMETLDEKQKGVRDIECFWINGLELLELMHKNFSPH